MANLITTLGTFCAADLGPILAHEHIFVDLGPREEANYRRARAADVVDRVMPEIEKIKKQGITAFVECTPEGVGRRVDIDVAVSQASGLPIVLPTGIYREPWVPEWAIRATEVELATWMERELTYEIVGTGVRAAWIKVSAGDEGLTDCERRILRAAARAGHRTGAVIGSHTIRGHVVREQLDIVAAAGYQADRFIWIHTQAEPDFDLHLEMAQRGAWIEYDAIGSDAFPDGVFVDYIRRLWESGHGNQILLSQDRGWYDPSQPNGGPFKPYTYLWDVFLPALRSAGFSQDEINQMTVTNPFDAYAR